LTRWRQRMGEEKLRALLQESLAVATRTEAMKPTDQSGHRAAIHCRCPVSFTVRAPWRRMILDPRLGAHLLCFELSDGRSETRWERCRECVFVFELEATRPVRHEAALDQIFFGAMPIFRRRHGTFHNL
jgi:hypothetical protein